MAIDISEEGLAKESTDLLNILLKDRTTKQSIVWATHSYDLLGKGFSPSDGISPSKVTGDYANLIQPRSGKSTYEQKDRTKVRAEVFTPTWLVKKQNGYVELEFEDLALEDYVHLRWLEITCGEAPYMVTRYDTVTGEEIPLAERVGFVDRKLQRISREISDEVTFYEFVKSAYRASYGYEYQGDSLLLARENLLATFEDYYLAKTGNQPTLEQKKEIATIISYNVFQMDGLKKTSPHSAGQSQSLQLSLFVDKLENEEVEEVKTQIRDWKKNRMIGFGRLSSEESEMKFDVVIGNPPYNDENIASTNKAPSIYHYFIDEAIQISEKSILIHPARFLFNAGDTDKKWNYKMLNNQHFKVLLYEQESGKIFQGTDIKGGVAITYQDKKSIFDPILIFTNYKELNSILHKVIKNYNFESIDSIVYNQNKFNLDELYLSNPEYSLIIGSNGKDKRLRNNIFSKIDAFTSDKKHSEDYKILGLDFGKRVWKFINSKFIDNHPNLHCFKVALPESNGSGVLGELFSKPLILNPNEGYTQTFISIGEFNSKYDANNCLKYIKTKFLRTMLGVLKITQHNPISTWKYVPLQDFTGNSDIDWTQSVADIDRQLYQKYDLSPEEIAFIESHVREMD